jgi:hypothetical protein
MNENTPDVENFFNFGKKPSVTEVLSKPKTVQPEFKPEPIKVERIEKPVEIVHSPKTDELDRSGMQYVGQISNMPTRAEYPERRFDQYVKKDARLDSNDLSLIKGWSDRIAHNKRKLGLTRGSDNRITDNTILRLILSEFCNRFSAEYDLNSSNEVTSEEELKIKIASIMSKR